MMFSMYDQALIAIEYERIGQLPGESWFSPPYDMLASEYIAFLRLVPSGSGSKGFLAARVTLMAERVLRTHAGASFTP